MKNKFLKYSAFVGMTLMATGCGEDFLNRPPQSQIVVDNFYQTKEQILAATSMLYGEPWFNFHDKLFIQAGELAGGNAIGWGGNERAYVTFEVSDLNLGVTTGWPALYRVIGFANSLITELPKQVPSSISKEVVNGALAEARFNRALAYFYLVRAFGAVPIVENQLDIISGGEVNVPRNLVEDVYKFIIRDLEFAETNGYSSKMSDGRVSKWTAKALLSKIYLYQKNYAKAREKAEEVINSGQYKLTDNYEDNFRALKNNGPESIYAFQWSANNRWGAQNTLQAYVAMDGITEVNDGWGSFLPSVDLQLAYEKGDKRLRNTYMAPGDFYPELVSKTYPKGYTFPKDRSVGSTRAMFRKHIVGAPPANGGTDGPVDFMKTSLNSNVLRFAEIYLIAAEAILAGGQSTGDAKAVEYFNKVRLRAGLPTKLAVTADDIFKERRIELAGEGEFFYDIQRQGDAKALAIISNQERGNYPNSLTAPVNSFKVKSSDVELLFPIPAGELSRSPKLKDQPVPYNFK
jgi:starch-binding outer membrane protein, SusD/RagB family